jgi:hypothetical protein
MRESTDMNQRNGLPPGDAIQTMMKVIDPWLNYYHHTDYFAGINRIQQCFNDCTQRCITNLQANQSQKDLKKYIRALESELTDPRFETDSGRSR